MTNFPVLMQGVMMLAAAKAAAGENPGVTLPDQPATTVAAPTTTTPADGLDTVRSATIQIVGQGTFVDPAQAAIRKFDLRVGRRRCVANCIVALVLVHSTAEAG